MAVLKTGSAFLNLRARGPSQDVVGSGVIEGGFGVKGRHLLYTVNLPVVGRGQGSSQQGQPVWFVLRDGIESDFKTKIRRDAGPGSAHMATTAVVVILGMAHVAIKGCDMLF